jgi:hypothetical protein
MAASTDVGVRQNARLTGLTAALLIVLLFLEGITILEVQSLIVLHFVIGTLIIAPVFLKISTTGYKIFRYYTHAAPYVEEGPPPLVRRVLGPVVVVTSLGLLGSGVMLGLAGRGNGGQWLFLHKAFFVLWFMAMTLHVLLHLERTLRAVVFEYFARKQHPLPGWSSRQIVLVVVVLIGIGLGVWSVSYAHSWQLVSKAFLQ